MNSKSLRGRLFLLYIICTSSSMICLGCFSYWYLKDALASSRQHTMEAREKRLVQFVDSWPPKDTSLTLGEKLRQLSFGIANTDMIQVYELNGTPIYSSPGDPAFKVPWPDRDCVERCNGLVKQNGHQIRTLNHVVTLDGHTVRLSLSGNIDEHFEILNAIRNSYLLFCPLVLVASVVGGFFFSNRALEPVSRMTAEAREIGIQDLGRRLPVPDTGDELQLLAESWNELLGRIETAVARLSQFTGDLSHDLSTTITVMMTTSGLALSRDRSKEEYRAALNTISVECEATSQLLDDLLAIARADLVQQNIQVEPLDISGTVSEVCDQFEALASLKRQTLRAEISRDVMMLGDASLLRRMTAIFIDNAIKYTPDAGSILVSLSIAGNPSLIRLQVNDTGIGIPADALPRIFDRFYQVDKVRNQDDGGSGLGLSIAKWVAEAHHATIHVDSKPGEGSTFTVLMPGHLQICHSDFPQASAVLA